MVPNHFNDLMYFEQRLDLPQGTSDAQHFCTVTGCGLTW